MAAGLAVKQEGKAMICLTELQMTLEFGLTRADIDKIISESCFTGIGHHSRQRIISEKSERCLQQTVSFSTKI